jgi:hypothetical protein
MLSPNIDEDIYPIETTTNLYLHNNAPPNINKYIYLSELYIYNNCTDIIIIDCELMPISIIRLNIHASYVNRVNIINIDKLINLQILNISTVKILGDLPISITELYISHICDINSNSIIKLIN